MGKAWECWAHPRRTARALQEAQDELEEVRTVIAQFEAAERALRTENDRLQALADDLAHRRDKLDEGVKNLSLQLVDTNNRLNDSRREADNLRLEAENLNTELKELRQVRAALSDFEKRLDSVDKMKQHYEERVARLRAKVLEQQQELALLRPSAPPIPPDESDWLLPLD